MSQNLDESEMVDFPFAQARRITPEEVAAAKRAAKEQFGIEPGERGQKLKLGKQKDPKGLPNGAIS
jgi:hypothetical protein